MTHQPAPAAAGPVVERFPASHFRRYPTNREIPQESIDAMAASVREVGLLDPILARSIPGETELEIIAGETRWLGCRKIDPEFPVPCFLRALSDKEAAKIHAVSNFQRKDLNAIEEGREIRNLLTAGWAMDEIMEQVGKAKDYLYVRLELAEKMPPEAHAAYLDGNLALETVRRIAMLPEDQRVAAVEAVVRPIYSAAALSQRDAIKLIQRDFVEPLERAAEWEAKREAVMKNHPGTQWRGWDEARELTAWNSGFAAAGTYPGYETLCDAARIGEMVVPTWGELATKHGAPIVIGAHANGEAEPHVRTQPLIDAEKAACQGNPGDCIFLHEGAIQQQRDETERRKIAQAAHKLALAGERERIARLVLAPDGISKTAAKKLVELCFLEVCENYLGDDLPRVLGIDLAAEDAAEKGEAAILRYLRSKAMPPWEAMARLQVAAYLTSGAPAAALFEVLGLKPAEFPAHHKDYLAARAASERVETAEREFTAALDQAGEEGA